MSALTAKQPHHNQLQQKLGDQVVVIGVTEEGADTVIPFIKSIQMNYIVGAGSSLTRAYRVQTIPYALVIDQQGVIVWQGYPDAELDRVVGALIKTGTSSQPSA